MLGTRADGTLAGLGSLGEYTLGAIWSWDNASEASGPVDSKISAGTTHYGRDRITAGSGREATGSRPRSGIFLCGQQQRQRLLRRPESIANAHVPPSAVTPAAPIPRIPVGTVNPASRWMIIPIAIRLGQYNGLWRRIYWSGNRAMCDPQLQMETPLTSINHLSSKKLMHWTEKKNFKKWNTSIIGRFLIFVSKQKCKR